MSLDDILDMEGKSIFVLLVISMVAIVASGLFFGFVYYIMNTLQTTLQSVNCTIVNNVLVGNCQQLFQMSFYQLLNMKSFLIIFTYVFIFAEIGGLLVLSYRAGKSPMLIGFIFVYSILVTYGAVLISNIYRKLLTNPIVFNMMQPFTIYNKIMLGFPWFIGMITLISLGLSIINWQRTRVNTVTSDLDY